MPRSFKVLATAVLCAGLSSGVFAAEAPRMNIYNAETKDVLGVWDLVAIKSDNPQDKAGPQYQRWVFKDDGVMRHIGSTNPITDTDMKVNAALPPNTTYKVKNSILEMKYKEPPITASMRCFMVEKIFPERMGNEPEKPGDMILAAYRTHPETPDIMWILRKK